MQALVLLLTILGVQSILDRDYYKALNVPISAGPQQIRESFKKLSRKYHPDRNPNPNSRKRFQKINVAYETLSNERQKYLYDRLGPEKMNNPNIEQQVNLATLKGGDLTIKVVVTLEDLYNGKQIQAQIFKKMVCPHCLGSGAQNDYDLVRCSECQGQGKTTKKVHVGGGYYNMMSETCPRCKGRGKIVGRKCNTCSGNMIIALSQEFKVKIAPGAFNGDALRYTNMGDEREEGAPGDLLLKIQQPPHAKFVREGNTLRTSISVTLKQALFGFTRSITQLDGRELTVSREQITQPGQQIIIEGQGMPIKYQNSKGNMIVTVNVSIPEYSPEQLQKLSDLFDEL